MRRGGDANSSAAQPDVGTSLSGLTFIKILFRACGERGERERAPRSPLRENPRRRFHATINVLSPPPRRGPHTLALRPPRGCFFVARTYVLLFIFFSVRSYVRTQLPFIPFVHPSAHSFVRSFLGPNQRVTQKERGWRRLVIGAKTSLLLKCA